MSNQFSLFDVLADPENTTSAESTTPPLEVQQAKATEEAKALIESDDIAGLAKAIAYHNDLYFNQAAPLLEDTLFDRLVLRLRELSPEHSVLSELGETPSVEFSVSHRRPMLSLQKAYSAEEISTWLLNNQIEGALVESPKVDGLAASLRYDAEGKLALALTRGDGEKGEPFTLNADYIDEIPKQIAYGPLEVRGEMYLPLSVFNSKFADKFANPRNTAAGAIKQKEPYKTGDYGLRFFAYNLFLDEGCPLPKPQTLEERLALAQRLGFPVVPHRVLVQAPVFDPSKLEKLAESKDKKKSEQAQRQLAELQAAHAKGEWLSKTDAESDIQTGYEDWQIARATIDYELDGVVYTANTLSEHTRLGETSHHPRYGIAYKFQGDMGQSTILEIEWSVSRTGAITPVAFIEPVELSGAMVSRASLHNLTILRTHGASAGATVLAMRRGGVIPHIERVINPGPEPAILPEFCPSCGSPTKIGSPTLREGNDSEVEVLYCTTPLSCPLAIRGNLEHYLKAVEIDGFGPKILDALVERRMTMQPADFYRLGIEDLANLDRLGRKSATNLVTQIEEHRHIPLAHFLYGLGVESLGTVAANKLAVFAQTIEKVRSLEVDDLFNLDISPTGKITRTPLIPGFGEKIASSFIAGLKERDHLIQALLDVGVTVLPRLSQTSTTQEPVIDGPLSGQSFVFTGKLMQFTREQAQSKVRSLGGSTPDDVNAKLSYLVVANDGKESSKQKKAAKLIAEGKPLKIMTEDEFLALVGSV